MNLQLPPITRAILFLGFLLISACHSVDRQPLYRESAGLAPDYDSDARVLEAYEGRLPWEVWPLDYDLEGNALENAMILEGDELLRTGDRRGALSRYRGVRSVGTSQERDALSIRLASTELALGNTTGALSEISALFRGQQKGVEDVDERFSLVLAYAYARAGNIDQSLAWFSKAHRLSGGRGGIDEAARRGIRSVLKSRQEDELNGLSEKWSSDAYVASLLGQERRRRLNAPGENLDPSTVVQAPNPAGAQSVVGVVLPLSGQFASLGESTRNGIELALSQQGDVLSTVVKDSGADSTTASTSVNELIVSRGATVLIGPLLSEQANVVSDIARRSGLPLVTFSKKDTFQTGSGIFRLGATARSQVDSLVDASSRSGLSRFALVYPADPNGQEFARAFKSKLSTSGLQLVLEASYPKNSAEALVNIARDIEKAQPQAVFFPDNLLNASRFFSLISFETLKTLKPIGPASWDNLVELNQSRNVMDGAIFVSPFFSQSANPDVTRFVEAYKEKYKQSPNFLAAQGFDAATIVASALRNSQQQGIPFSNALMAINEYRGLTGNIQIDENGEFRRNYNVVEFVNGTLRELHPDSGPTVPTPNLTLRSNEYDQTIHAAAASQ